MRKKIKRKKEEIAEDWCFVCKDGGLLMVCDYKDCLKAYHPSCVGKDDSFLEADYRWTCASHFCSLCHKASKFACFCCPTAVCAGCIYGADFAIVKGKKGLCCHCTQIALLIEENASAYPDGVKIDFKNPETYECLFAEYYEIVKEKEGLKSKHVYSAHSFLNSGRNTSDYEQDEMGEGDDTGESDDERIVSDYDDLHDTARNKLVGKKKRCVKEMKSMKGRLRDNKKEFIGWGSRILIEFLHHFGKDTSREFSEQEVVSIIMDYCKEKKLFDPKKKKKVICDETLRSLLGRKSVNRNNIHNLIGRHFAENLEEMEVDISSCSEDRDDNEPLKFSTQRRLTSSTQSHQNVVSEEQQSYFAAIVSSNLKLVYLKRSLVEELLKQPENFDCKVMGSFVRVKCDPYDYSQKNSHKLEQVLGIKRSKNDEINKEIMLKLSNVPKDVPICKISDDDFTEEECKDLDQRMRNGLLKQPTVRELDQKARSLHEDIIKHWIPREIRLLQIRIEQANERGKRRELFEYMERKLKLETQSEQARLLSDIPKVIPEIVDSEMSPEGSPREDNIEQDTLVELAVTETCKSGGYDFKHSWNGTTDVADGRKLNAAWNAKHTFKEKQGNLVAEPVETQSEQTCLLSDIPKVIPEIVDSKLSPEGSPRDNIEPDTLVELAVTETCKSGGRDFKHSWNGTTDVADGGNLNAAWNAKHTVKEKQSNLVAEPVESSVNNKQDTSISATPVREHKLCISTVDVIELSDDEEHANTADTSAGIKVVENPEVPVWHCLGPYGERTGPYSMFLLKRWSETAPYPLGFKVWKTGQSEKEAILLTDALRQIFPRWKGRK